MKETQFIEQNKEKWAEYETMIGQRNPDPEKVFGLFYSISDDLAFARAHYPNRSVRVYLNNLARGLFRNVYSGKRISFKGLVDFWKKDLPAALYATRKEQGLALAVFLISGLIGMVSCLSDESFASHILGKGYVDMTLENIKKGNPMAVYDEQSPFSMFLYIAKNNLTVCFLSFASGVVGGLGTLYVLLYNGIMVGTFQFFFARHNLLWDSFLTIWLHGGLEISSIVVGAGAGFTIGKGILFPGTYTRLQSVVLAGRRAITIMVGIFPIIVLAAFIESYMTRYYFMPAIFKLALILATLGFMVFYFGVYPAKVGRTAPEEKVQSDGLSYLPETRFETGKVFNGGEITGFALRFSMSMLAQTWFQILAGSLLYIFIVYEHMEGSSGQYLDVNRNSWNKVFFFLESLPVYLIHVGLSTYFSLITAWKLYKKWVPQSPDSTIKWAGRMLPILLLTHAGMALAFLGEEWSYPITIWILPFFFLLPGMFLARKVSFLKALIMAWDSFTSAFGRILFCFLVFLILAGLSVTFFQTPLANRVFELIVWNMVDGEDNTSKWILNYAPALLGYACLMTGSIFLTALSGFLAHTLLEIREASNLLNRIRQQYAEPK